MAGKGRPLRERNSYSSLPEKSIWFMLNIFKIPGAKRRNAKYGREEATKVKAAPPRRARVSDEDAGFWGAGEPDIDQKASDYIARFYQHRG